MGNLSSRADPHKAARTAQRVQGGVFLFMGGACVVAPQTLLRLSLSRPPTEEAAVLIFQCFGAQACLAGLLLCTSRLSVKGLYCWATAMLPFIVLDGYLYAKGTLTAFGAGGDLAGNLTFITLSMLGARHLRRAGKDE